MEQGRGAGLTRNSAVDLIKMIAILGVVMIHTCCYDAAVLSFDWTSAVILRCMVSASVPLFFMCSGALLLNPQKKLTIKRLFTRNLPRIIVAMLVWAMLYQIYDLIVGQCFSMENLIHAMKEVLVFKQKFHLYFLHILIAVYLWTPVTRVLVAHASRRELQYALGLWFALGILYPMLCGRWPFTLMTDYPKQWMLNATYTAIGYGVAGYYLTTYQMNWKHSIILILTGFAIVLGGTIWLSYQAGTLRPDYLEGEALGMALLAFGLFGFLTGKPQWGNHTVVQYLAKASFCVYLVHVFVLSLFQRLGLRPITPYLLTIPVLTVANVAVSCIAYELLRRIPLVKDWLI